MRHLSRARFGYISIRRAAVSSALSRSCNDTRPASITSSSVPLTVNGAPIATAIVENGFGICVRSQLFIVQKRSDSM